VGGVAAGAGDHLAPHAHLVNFYDDEADIVAELTRFVAEGLCRGEAVVVVATQAHRDALAAGLAGYGVDGGSAGRYECLDAAGTLAAFMVDGAPDRSRFRTVVGGLVARAAAGGRPVRAFGEMVALLWADGNVPAAIRLESLWNELGREYPFSLYCAYPVAVLATADDLTATGHVCDRHSSILGPLSYTAPATGVPDLDNTTQRCGLFLPVPTAVPALRRFLRDTLTAWDEHTDLIDDALLIGTELATNAVLHARSPFRASIRRSDAAITIALHDISAAQPLRPKISPATRHGRGITLVANLSHKWGSDIRPDGKVVWSELAH
jgi:hypothetical protein